MNQDPIIQLENVNKWFGDLHVLQDVNLTVGRKERIVVCGPSGSGKSTMIRCINRLEEHQQGRIVVDGIELTGNLKNIDRIRSEVGMVFQQFNLFPHLTVKENITLAPIWVRKMPKKDAEELAMQHLEQVKIQKEYEFAPTIEILDYPIAPLGPHTIRQTSTTQNPVLIVLLGIVGFGFAVVMSLAKGYFATVDGDEKVRLKGVVEEAKQTLNSIFKSRKKIKNQSSLGS